MPRLTLPELLASSASRYTKKPALHMIQGETLTYEVFNKRVHKVMSLLKAYGIQPGDHICLLSENSPHWATAYFSIVSLGAVVVPILSEFHTHAITHIINDCSAQCIFVSEGLKEKIDTSQLQHSPFFIPIELLSTVSDQHDQTEIYPYTLKAKSTCIPKEKSSTLPAKEPYTVQEDDLAAIIYTSGTTQHSKGVMLSHKNIVFDAMAVEHIETVSSCDRFLSLLPLSHVYECTLGLVLPLMKGSQVFYLGKRPTPKAILSAVHTVKPTIMLIVPLLIEKIYKNTLLPQLTQSRWKKILLRLPVLSSLLLQIAGKKLLQSFGGSLRALIIGGAPLNTEVAKFLFRAKFPYIIGYGLTETSSLVSANCLANPHLFTAGPAVKGIHVRIDKTTSSNDVGEIQVKGDNVMQGYYKQPETTKEVFTEDGWFKTGDLGSLDPEGFLFIKGRSKNMLLGASGENIYPEEIESFLLSSPYVLEALVCMFEGKLSAKVYLDTTKIDALLETKKSMTKESLVQQILEEIRLSVNGQVASFAKILRMIEQKEPFERTPTQKIKRYLYLDNESR